MTFFMPPPDAASLPRWRFDWIKSSGFCAPDNVWIRGNVEPGSLLKWSPDDNKGSGNAMIVCGPEDEPIAVAVEPYP